MKLMMKPNINTQKLKELLNNSTMQLSPRILEGLRAARTRALGHQRVRQIVPALAFLGYHGSFKDLFHASRAMNLAVAIVLMVFVINGVNYWQNYSIEHEISEIDIAILTGDMPLHIYVDD